MDNNILCKYISDKYCLFRIVSIFVGVLVSVLLLEIILNFLPVCNPPLINKIDETNYIYRRQPNKDFVWSNDGKFSILTEKHSNNYGFINKQDYYPDKSTPLLAIIGDSYVEALMVPDGFTLSDRLQKAVGDRGRVYSFGVSGAQLPTYLAFSQYAAKNFRPKGMVFTIVGNDYDESLSVYGNRSGFYYFLPQQNGTMIWRRSEFIESYPYKLFHISALYRYCLFNLRCNSIVNDIKDGVVKFMVHESVIKDDTKFVCDTSTDTSPERVALSKLAIDEFLKLLPYRSGLPANQIAFAVAGRRYPEGLNMPKVYFDIMYEYFKQKARDGGFEVIDLQTAFVQHYQKFHQHFEFPTDGHWNEVAHQVVADQIKDSKLYHKVFLSK